ncbi:putative protein, contains IPT/TIG domain [Handroanthus impetiginosus]|uniref:CG-1 domain-containing protein n=1 Tax=Handroanthus impetiginosus TaxID=429701 RepID=A0A2G9GJ79_9LAMI|nr:putative protein, contains IPT/TIG domain [Handroanthus impetiginosus]
MESDKLVGSEIHGFRTMEDLDVDNMMEEAKSRWLRPNEIHAMLSNHKYFTVNVKPMNLPKSGTIVFFDRKMLRNFRKDGYNWKKKKDGKTVKEAHEHLKVGNVERIHVYYAHGEQKPTFVRRCYWLLDKSLEHIVLVHYRETQEGSPAASGSSHSSSGASDPPAPRPLLEESDSTGDRAYYGGNESLLERQDSMTIKYHQQRLHEINTLDWDELVVPDDPNKMIALQQATGNSAVFEQTNQYLMNSYKIVDDASAMNKVTPESSVDSFPGQVTGNNSIDYNISNDVPYPRDIIVDSQSSVSGLGLLPEKGSLQPQDSFDRWVANIIADTPGALDNQVVESSISTGNQSFSAPTTDDHLRSALGQIFNITDISPSWALSTEETKILVVGVFNGGQVPNAVSNLHLACGDSIVPVETVQAGVFRCVILPQTPGLVNLYLSLDGHKPISQVINFQFRAPVVPNQSISLPDKSNWEEFQIQMRLAHLLFSSSKSLSIFSTKVSPSNLREAKSLAQKISYISNGWVHLSKTIKDAKIPFPQAKDDLFELILRNRLQEWLLEKVAAGCKISERDKQGQGVIHLCAILGYTWAVLPFSCSGLSMDYRDKYGWTALHWAAYYGREKTVAALLSAGAKPYLVTDPTSENPSGCTPADLAYKNGFEGLAGYLAEKALLAQFNDMTLAGNVSGSLQTTSSEIVNPENFTEEELYLKDTLAAYRTAADAAARIHSAFRERSLKLRTEAVEASTPEMEARNIIAAMKIQHAFRNYESRKKLAAASRIQYRFRTWKIRKDFLNMRRQAVKIQAAFRAFQARKQYCKIVWSVGILEKAVLRWRMKRKGFRGLQVQLSDTSEDPNQENDAEEDFFKASRKQAEERVERSVIRVQAMFRSKRAQEDYRRMKLEHNKATLEYEGLLHPDVEMR